MLVWAERIQTELLKRLSFESLEVHTLQVQVGTGIPCEVPVPKKVKLNGGCDKECLGKALILSSAQKYASKYGG